MTLRRACCLLVFSLHLSSAQLLRPQSSSHLNSPDISMCRGHPDWEVTFEDEFNGTSVNTSNWVVVDGLQEPHVLYQSDDVKVEDGKLVFTTQKREVQAKDGKRFNFTSGGVNSEGKRFQKFGRFEVRAKLPNSHAGEKPYNQHWSVVHASHWMMPNQATSNPPRVCWPVGGEIDIMEGYQPDNREPGSSQHWQSEFMTYHWGTQCGKDEWESHKWIRGNYSQSSEWFSSEYHTYGVEWNETSVQWFVDGIKRNEIHAGTPKGLYIPQDPFYMILDTNLMSWADAALDHGFPLVHKIDRVTWCQKKEK